jgi:hypothetical protein
MPGRPADDDYNMVPPNQFNNYRKRRHLKYPCCLCAYMKQQDYVESIVYSWQEETEGTLVWRARCAMDICGYQGQFFFHPDYVHFFDLPNYPVKINKYFQLHMQSISVYRLRGELLSLTITYSMLTKRYRKSASINTPGVVFSRTRYSVW